MCILNEHLLVFAILAILVIAYIYYNASSEGFSSKREKAAAIYNWFGANETPVYKNYKRDLNQASNIVEYEDTLLLKQKNELSVDNIEKIL